MDIDVSTKVVGVVVGKVCPKCGEWKDFSRFQMNRYAKSGYQNYCRDCVREYDNTHKERRAARRKEYESRNAEKLRLRRAERAEELRERKREYSQTERGMAVNKARYATRRARELNAGGSFTAADIEAIRKAQGNRCYICGKKLKKYHIDHFIPLAKGGTNDPGNLRLACPACNLRKSAKHPQDIGLLI